MTMRSGCRIKRIRKQLIEYVLIHELCHLAHRNHEDGFWATAASFLPDFKERQKHLEDFEASAVLDDSD